jgi:hypothetical protein
MLIRSAVVVHGPVLADGDPGNGADSGRGLRAGKSGYRQVYGLLAGLRRRLSALARKIVPVASGGTAISSQLYHLARNRVVSIPCRACDTSVRLKAVAAHVLSLLVLSAGLLRLGGAERPRSTGQRLLGGAPTTR